MVFFGLLKIEVREMVTMKSVLRRCICAFGLAAFPSESFAITMDNMKVAGHLLTDGKAAEAKQLIRENLTSEDGPQAWFLLGKANEQLGNLSGAILAYSEVLKRDPAAGRVKLDLALAYANAGEPDKASRLFNEVRASNPPERVRQNIDRYLALLNGSENGSAFQARFEGGVLYDSNVNQGTDATSITMFGLPFTLSRDARRRSDWAYTVSADLDHIVRFNPQLAWQSNLHMGWRDYFKENDLDSLTLGLSTGPVWSPSQKTIVSMPLYINYTNFPSGNGDYVLEVGISPQVRHKLTDKVTANLSSNVVHSHYFDDSKRDGWSYSVSPSLDFNAWKGGVLSLGGTIGRNDAGNCTQQNNMWGLNASLTQEFTPNFVMMAWLGYEDHQYDCMEAAYSEVRHDQQYRVGIDAVYSVKSENAVLNGLDAKLSWSHVENQSNLDLNKFSRDQVSASLKKKF